MIRGQFTGFKFARLSALVLAAASLAACSEKSSPPQSFKGLRVSMSQEEAYNATGGRLENNIRILTICMPCSGFDSGFVFEDASRVKIDGWEMTLGYEKLKRKGPILHISAVSEMDREEADRTKQELIAKWGEPNVSISTIIKVANSHLPSTEYMQEDQELEYMFWGGEREANRTAKILSSHDALVQNYKGPTDVTVSPELGDPVGALMKYNSIKKEMTITIKGRGKRPQYQE